MFSYFKNAIMLFLVYAGMCLGQSVWTAIYIGAAYPLTSVTYGNGNFVVVGNECAGAGILNSTDGIAWTKNYSNTVYDLTSVTYGNGQFVAVGDLGTILVSPDGVTWTTIATTVNTGAVYNLNSVTFGNGQFVAVGCEGIEGGCMTDVILTSSNGINWTTNNFQTICNPDSFYDLLSVTYGDSQFVIIGYNGWTGYSTILTTHDAITWTQKSLGNMYAKYITYGNSQFVAISGIGGTDQHIIYTSPDATTWTKTGDNPALLSGVNSVIYGNNQFVAVGNFPYEILTSSDAKNWKTIMEYNGSSGSTAYNFRSVTYGSNLFVTVGNPGGGGATIFTSKADNIGVIQTSYKQTNAGEFKINIGKNSIAISLPNTLTNETVTVGLFAITGKKIYSTMHHAYNGILNIPVSRLSTGRYLISILNGNNEIWSYSFVVVK